MKAFKGREQVNIPGSRGIAKNMKKECEKCGHKFTGYTSDDLTNNYLTCVCKKCGHKNHYLYWGMGSIVKKRSLLSKFKGRE